MYGVHGHGSIPDFPSKLWEVWMFVIMTDTEAFHGFSVFAVF